MLTYNWQFLLTFSAVCLKIGRGGQIIPNQPVINYVIYGWKLREVPGFDPSKHYDSSVRYRLGHSGHWHFWHYLLGFTLSVLAIGFISYVFGSIIFEVSTYLLKNLSRSTCKNSLFIRDHSFKTSANFHDFWPLPPPVGRFLLVSVGKFGKMN